MNRPAELPLAVVAGLERYARRHEGETLESLRERLAWDALGGHYYFWRGNIFHGVELDGHIHT